MKNYKKIIGSSKPLWQKFYEKTFSKLEIDATVHDDIKKLWTKNYYKSYSRLPIKHLEIPRQLPKKRLINSLIDRESSKNFVDEPISLETLSGILYFSAGLKDGYKEDKRFYPSAGARYPLEVYVLNLKVNGLKKGLYHYYNKEHGLEFMTDFDKKEIEQMFLMPWIMKAGVIIIITAYFQRTMIKYGDRGYNYIFIEAGHLGQNIALLSTAYKLAVCPVGGFIEHTMNKFLNIDPEFESVIYTLALGRSKS